jgi:hypothetical protein
MNTTNQTEWILTGSEERPSGDRVFTVARGEGLTANITLDQRDGSVSVVFLGANGVMRCHARAEATRLAAVAWDYAGDVAAGLVEDEDADSFDIDASALQQGTLALSGAAAFTLVAVHLGLAEVLL